MTKNVDTRKYALTIKFKRIRSRITSRHLTYQSKIVTLQKGAAHPRYFSSLGVVYHRPTWLL